MTQFKTDTGAMSGWQQRLGDVSTDAGNLLNGPPGVSGVQNSHGTIGHPMQSAFDAAQSARGSAVGATQGASTRIADLLRQAAQAYERGDTAAAGQLKARAEQLDGAGSPAAGGSGAGGAGGGSQAAGQMMSQFGQLAGQLGQSVTQPLQGLAQGLGQIPQQVFQGVQGIVDSATGAAGGAADAGAAAGEGEGAEQIREMHGEPQGSEPKTADADADTDTDGDAVTGENPSRPTVNPRDL